MTGVEWPKGRQLDALGFRMDRRHCRGSASGFTLVELLVVIVIITITAALLFPVFSQAREKARVSTCQSNLQQLAMAILLYNQDDDEIMPIGFKQAYQIGPLTSSLNGGIPESGLSQELLPYTHSSGVFLDLDDKGVEWYSPNGSNCEDDPPVEVTCTAVGVCTPVTLSTANIAPGSSYYSVYGISYKFTYENYSNPFPNDNETGRSYMDIKEYPTSSVSGVIRQNGSIQCGRSYKQKFNYVTAATVTHAPPLIAMSFFARPSQSSIVHCADSSFDPGDDYVWHPGGEAAVYLDGHAKFLTSAAGLDAGCDGPDWAWDIPGSCNVAGLQRSSN